MVQQRRSFSDNDKAAALAALDANGGNVYKTAKELGVSYSTLHSWSNGVGVNSDVSAVRDEKKIELADKLEAVANRYADHLLEDATVLKTGAKDAAITVGTAIDKMRLLRGLPTEIIQVIPPLVQAIQDAGLQPADVFNAMLAELHAHNKRTA